MNLRQIEVFRAVMLAGTVSDAARLLHVSQPGVSRMLGHIELQLGMRLFERGRGRLKPTPEALELFSAVERVYRGVQRVEERARELKSGSAITFRILTSPSTALQIVPRAIVGLSARFPGAHIVLETHLVREMVAQLERHEADMAVSTAPINNELMASESVGRWHMVCAFPGGHAFEGRRQISTRALKGERIVAFAPDTPQGALVANWTDADQTTARIEVRTGQAACALVAAGAGVAIVDDLTARAWQGSNLSFRPLQSTKTFDAFVVQHASIARSAVASAFVEEVRRAFAELRRVEL